MTIYALCRDDFHAQFLDGLLDKDGHEIKRLESLDEALAQTEAEASRPLVLEDGLLPRGHSLRAAILARPGLVLVGDLDVTDSLQLVIGSQMLNHILIRNDLLLRRQLRSTLLQLVRGEAWGVKQYLAPGTHVPAFTLKSTDKKSDVIDKVARIAASAAGFTELAAVASTVASELIMNAIFNAPTDPATGQPKYRGVARDTSLALGPGEEVTVQCGHDDTVLALLVRDNFGGLSRETLRANLMRSAAGGDSQIRMRTPGAGVGLYMVLNSSTQLDVRVTRGKATEFVALLGCSKRYREFEGFGHSLNLFWKE